MLMILTQIKYIIIIYVVINKNWIEYIKIKYFNLSYHSAVFLYFHIKYKILY